MILSLLCCACGDLEFDVLYRDQLQENITWTCPDSTQVRQTSDSVAGSLYVVSRACLGTEGCPVASRMEPNPDDARCNNENTNSFVGTCVEAFFSCFDPAGVCTGTAEGRTYANGARVESYENAGSSLFPSDSDEPCIFVDSSGVLGTRFSRVR